MWSIIVADVSVIRVDMTIAGRKLFTKRLLTYSVVALCDEYLQRSMLKSPAITQGVFDFLFHTVMRQTMH